MKMLKNRVLLKPLDNSKAYVSGGIHIPENTKNLQNKVNLYYEVVEVGPDVEFVVEGNTVSISEFAGDKVEIDGITHRIVQEPHIDAIIEDYD